MYKSFAGELQEALKKQHYGIFGKHSAVKVCEWTKKSLTENNVCYKESFYKIKSHQCMEMTPAAGFCNFRCTYCWRKHELNQGADMEGIKIDEPAGIIDGLVQERKKLLIGFKGNDKVDQKKLQEAMSPKHAAISLTGEPTLYPKIGEMIDEFHKRKMTTYLVTNCSRPDVLEKIPEPTQLYLSVTSPTEEAFKRINVPLERGAWSKVQKTLELVPSFSCPTVMRLTMIAGHNMGLGREFAKVVSRAQPRYVEVKSFMLIGGARHRNLTLDNMPKHEELREFSRKLAEETSYSIKDEKADSRVVLLSK
ncbi:MAG: 4-demethylwyosine synthase TYW1 [archaeon]